MPFPIRRSSLLARNHGYTLVETMAAALAMSLLMLIIYKVSSGALKFFTRSQLRQQANIEARSCLETIDHTLSNAKASTLFISTPDTTPTVPNSRVSFSSVDGSSYTITWSATPLNTVHLQKIPPGAVTTLDTTLATHVNLLVFVPNAEHPSEINVSFQMTVPLDASGSPDSYYTISLLERSIHMMASE